MKTVLITGANGFIGKNLLAELETRNDIEILKYGSKNTLEQLDEFVTKADFIFHLAGVNRPTDLTDFETGNVKLTQALTEILIRNNQSTPILMSSSSQVTQNNIYGNSKKQAEKLLYRYGMDQKAMVYIFRLPNVFGKWCKPNYNSVIATWCFNISNDIPIVIHEPNKDISLVYIDDVVESFLSALDGNVIIDKDGLCSVRRNFIVTLNEISNKLLFFKDIRNSLQLPDLSDDFTKFLYSTFLSYYSDNQFGYNLNKKIDNRGWLAEFIKSKHFGQIFISRTKPGITRGNHWHHTKVEKFLVIEGSASINFRKIGSDSSVEYIVNGEDLKVIDIPPGYTHSIKNIGDSDLTTVFWANEIFDTDRPDTYYLEV